MDIKSDFNERYIKSLLPKRGKDAHKGTFGHVLNIAGSKFFTGAAYFSSIAPLKVGCGRSTLASCPTVIKSVSSISPDIIFLPLEETPANTISSKSVKPFLPLFENYDAVSIGCGLSTDKDTAKFFEEVIDYFKKKATPLVVDADGLTILSKMDFNELCRLPENTVLTPHPMEMSRLMNVDIDNILLQPEFWVKKCCEKYHCTVILKTHKTMIADNKGSFYTNTTGNSALAKGGSGDVLTGMITGFLASSKGALGTFEASVLSVWLHGKTAELASKDLTEYSTLASDLLNYIPAAIKELI